MNKFNENENITEPTSNKISLTRMRAGQTGKIIEIIGGHRLESRLDAFGIRKNKEIKKISEQWMKGPVLLRHGHSQIALGFMTASKIIVQVIGDGQ